MFQTQNKTILITGGLTGIGKALAKKAAEENNTLILVQRRSDEKVVKLLKDLGAKDVICLSYDLSDLSNIDKLYNDIASKNLSVDILVNNAGVLTGGVLEEQSPEKIQKMLTVNLTAPILLTQKFLPDMINKGFGKIVNNASVTSKIPIPAASTYGASKSGLLHFTNCLRQELRGTGVSTLLMITPGVKTEMYDDIKTQYGKNMDTSFLVSITADEWATMVWDALKNNEHTVMPKGQERIGVFLSTYFPSLIEGRFDRYFSRKN